MIKTWSTPVLPVKTETVPCILCGGTAFSPHLNCGTFGYVRCKKCRLVQMNPQPVKEELISRYGTVSGKDYLAYELENESAFLQLQKLALKDTGFFKEQKKGNFLDAGCATGALPAFLRELGWTVTGVEISPAAEYAQKQRGLDIKTVPLEECNFPSDFFDVVHASHLIEHLKNPKDFLTEVKRILKPDGVFFITTPNISGFQAKLFGSRWRSLIFDHLYLFSVRTLKQLLEISGFKPERIKTWGGIAAGYAPNRLKKIIDKSAKFLGTGDVMIIKAIKKK